MMAGLLAGRSRADTDRGVAAAELPGDALIPSPDLVTTRSIIIRAESPEVWPWIAQIGQGRGGLYSYDRLENLLGCDIHSAGRIHSEWQDIQVGDQVRLAPEMALTAVVVDLPRALVLRGGDVPMGALGSPFDFTWAFTLHAVPGGGTRLVVRERYAYLAWWAALLVRPTSVVSAVMSWRMLHGIRDRAEGRPVGPSVSADAPILERASAADLAMLAMDAGSPVHEQFGALLVLDDSPAGFDAFAVTRLLDERARTVPRLRQRLRSLPPGCGRAVWVDDPSFEIARHLRVRPAPDDEADLLAIAAEAALEPLPAGQPLWRAALLTGGDGRVLALVVVVHHVLADGIGGLAMLGRLLDGAGGTVRSGFPRPRPSRSRLAVDAARERARAVRRIPATIRVLRTSFGAAGGIAPTPAAPCSLLLRTGARRRLGVARVDLARLRAGAHTGGGTVNDALLAAVTGALDQLLRARGEHVDVLRVAVPVATAEGTAHDVAPLLVGLLVGGGDRLQATAQTMRSARRGASGPAGVALLGPLFRGPARVGLWRVYADHQRRFHTLVSNVRGPGVAQRLGGVTVRTMIPVSVAGSGNVVVGFLALSYAGTLTVSLIADPDRMPDLPLLVTALQAELDTLAG
jgi:diacylglycerol O-acyltransferase